MEKRTTHANEGEHVSRNKPPFWERAVAAFGLSLFAALLGYLLYEAIMGDDSEPDIETRVTEIRGNGNNYVVLFEANNTGGITAEGILIHGELKRFGITVETAEVTFDYLPPGSIRKGGLFFRNDPREMILLVKASGYSKP